jgi:hypothetical protein
MSYQIHSAHGCKIGAGVGGLDQCETLNLEGSRIMALALIELQSAAA